MVITMSASNQSILQHSRLSRAEALAREIEEEISAGVLNTGDRLGTKDDLRQRFNVAVATVNEAVKLLDTRGMVEARPGPGGGVFVASPATRMRSGAMFMGFEWTEASMADYHEVRNALEPIIYHHAARHRSEADIRALRSILANMAAHLDQPRAYARYNTAFHRRIAKLSPNAPLRSMYVTLLDFFENDLAVENLPDAVHPDNIDVHRQLVDAIEQGDMAELELAIRRHDSHRLNLGMFKPATVSGAAAPSQKLSPLGLAAGGGTPNERAGATDPGVLGLRPDPSPGDRRDPSGRHRPDLPEPAGRRDLLPHGSLPRVRRG
jgi:GntR family transcriptional regulator, transcriptional repressor for pyruvate dehydrogenase complex